MCSNEEPIPAVGLPPGPSQRGLGRCEKWAERELNLIFRIRPGRSRLTESVEERFCRPEVRRIEPFCKLIVERLEECDCIHRTALIAQQPGEARGGAQFPGERALPARPVERPPEVVLGCGVRIRCTLQ